MMEVRFHPTPGTLEKDELHGATVVVIDVLRATSTIVAAMEGGAARIIPVESIDAVSRFVSAGDRGGKILAGEQKGLPVEGFDLFNSPSEFARSDIAGKTIILATSNGTPALVAASRAESVMICALRNVDAVAAAVEGAARLTVLCGGDSGRISSEDILCGGILLDRLVGRFDPDRMEDAASIARTVSASAGDEVEDFLRRTSRGRRLVDMGYGEDITWCSAVGKSGVVPLLRQGTISP